MHYSQSEKYELIRLVEQSDLGVNRTLKELKINKTTFYNWYKSYSENGFEGLAGRYTEIDHVRPEQSDQAILLKSKHLTWSI